MHICVFQMRIHQKYCILRILQNCDDSVIYLGVTLDAKINYENHTVSIISRVKKAVCCINRTFRNSVQPCVLAVLFKVLLRVSLLYCLHIPPAIAIALLSSAVKNLSVVYSLETLITELHTPVYCLS